MSDSDSASQGGAAPSLSSDHQPPVACSSPAKQPRLPPKTTEELPIHGTKIYISNMYLYLKEIISIWIDLLLYQLVLYLAQFCKMCSMISNYRNRPTCWKMYSSLCCCCSLFSGIWNRKIFWPTPDSLVLKLFKSPTPYNLYIKLCIFGEKR